MEAAKKLFLLSNYPNHATHTQYGKMLPNYSNRAMHGMSKRND
jgi:hypothetical protein